MRPRNLPEHRRSQLSECPPSAKLIYITLVHEGPLTQGQLVDETTLPKRTVRSALDRLERLGFVDSEVHFPDARKKVFQLFVDESEPDA
ncbi:winged helix-turn-helix domain-containing protein [Halomicroarcula sp. F13]|uniref:Winged helix-turn-helix domain-containing protein n=1 Tax=Haloarcula rubra TaxID=2487747 RepID=A0AAW4PWG3_9EURY|nr:helix-turn-helix domain-containing protein [Halomicroarcula rubra]MBX0325521.1 winged helix-turn-helix domain-containing protein [Halomicroarcula rubra]